MELRFKLDMQIHVVTVSDVVECKVQEKLLGWTECWSQVPWCKIRHGLLECGIWILDHVIFSTVRHIRTSYPILNIEMYKTELELAIV